MENEVKESKHQKFVRLASKRTQTVLNSIRLLKGLSATTTYEYTPAELEKIFSAIDEAVVELKVAYSEKPKAKPKTFTLLEDEADPAEPTDE